MMTSKINALCDSSAALGSVSNMFDELLELPVQCANASNI